MQHILPSPFIDDINRRLDAERAVGAHRPGYLDKYNQLPYNDTFASLQTLATTYHDEVLGQAVSRLRELRTRTRYQLDALRIAASAEGHTAIPEFLIGVEHCYDWAFQGYNNPFSKYDPVVLYQKIILERKNKSVAAYLLTKYPSYPQAEIEKTDARANAEQNQQDNARPAMGAEVHGAAAALGISIQICPEIEASIVRIRGLENIVNQVNERTTFQAWQHWRNNVLEPWLNSIAEPQPIPPNPAPGPGAHNPDNAPILAAQTAAFLRAWDLKNPIGAFRDRENRLRNSTWAEQRALFNANDPYDPFYLLESMRLLAFIVAYAQSDNFRGIPRDAQNLFYQQFFYSLTESLANCHRGVFDRVMMFTRDTMFSMHREHVEQNFYGAQNIIDDMVSFLLKTDQSDISQQTLVPSSVLNALFMRTLKICQNPEQRHERHPWAAIFSEVNNLQDPRIFERERPRLETIITRDLAQLSSSRTSIQRFKSLSPEIFLSQEQQELLAQLPLSCHNIFDNPQLAQQNPNNILQQIQRLPDARRFLIPDTQEQLARIIRKKIRIAQIRNTLHPALVAQYPSRVLPEAAGLAEALRNLLTDQARATAENATPLFAQLSKCAQLMRDTGLVRESLQLRPLMLRSLQSLANGEITLEQLRASDCVTRTVSLIRTLSAPRQDRSFEVALQAFLLGEPIEAESVFGRIIDAHYNNAPDMVRDTQVSYFEQDQLPVDGELPSVHDFLRNASLLSGLSVPYLKLVLAILGRQRKDLLTRPEQDDPLDGEVRPLNRGLQILADNYRSILQAGPRSHSVLLSESNFIQELLAYHSICAQNYHAAEQDRKVQLASYCGTDSITYFHSPLTSHIQMAGRSLPHLVFLLNFGEVELVEEILVSLATTHQQDLTDVAGATTALKQVLSWIHLHQYYRIFGSLLNLSKVLNIKEAVFDADLLCKTLSFKKAGVLLPLLHTLQKEESLIHETAVILSRVDISESYIRALLCHWEDFSYILDAERLQQRLPGIAIEEVQRIVEGLEFQFLKSGFILENNRNPLRDINFIFIYRMINYAISHQNAQSANYLFDSYIAPVWQQASGERILNERLANLIVQLQYNANSDKNIFIRHVAQWCRQSNLFGAHLRLDLNCVPATSFQRRFSVEDIEYLAFVAEAFNIRAIVLPNQFHNRISFDVLQKMEEYRYTTLGPQVKFFYSMYGQVSFRDLIRLVIERLQKVLKFLVDKIKALCFGARQEQEQVEQEPQREEPAEDRRTLSQIYRAHRPLRFSSNQVQEQPVVAERRPARR